jgi:hypothetical protein
MTHLYRVIAPASRVESRHPLAGTSLRTTVSASSRPKPRVGTRMRSGPGSSDPALPSMTPSGHLCGIAEGMSLLQGGFVVSLGGTTLQDGVHGTGFWGIAARSRFATSIVPGFVAPPGPGMGLIISAEITSAHAEHVTFGSNRCPQDLWTNSMGLPSRGRAQRSPHAVRARIAGTRSRPASVKR